jgi:hypothetical protein
MPARRRAATAAENGPTVASAVPDRLAQLERLAALHDRGALTDAEFDEQKHELMAAH